MKCLNTGKRSFTQPSWSVYMYEHENEPCLLYDYIEGKQDLKDFLRFEIFSIHRFFNRENWASIFFLWLDLGRHNFLKGIQNNLKIHGSRFKNLQPNL